MQENFFVYLILNIKDHKTISYVGWTNNLKKRLQLHNSGKGAKFTRGRKWVLIFKKKMKSKISALQFEYKLKKNFSYSEREFFCLFNFKY